MKHFISTVQDHEDVARLLIENGADIETQDEFGSKPLHYAVYKGNKNIVKLLIENGTDVDCKNNYETTPLMIAAMNINNMTGNKREEKLHCDSS